MHELSIMQGIFDIVMEKVEEHRIKKISKVNVVVGELSGVEPAALSFAFSFFVQNTLAEGAELTITEIGVTGRCRRCGINLVGTSGLTCGCNQPPDYELLTGMELYVDSIIGETKEQEE